MLDRALGLTSRLLARAPLFTGVQRALSFTLSARQQLDRVLDAGWSALNVPSYGDVERLEAELARARATITALESRIAALADARESGSR